MPYKLYIAKEEVEKELIAAGFTDFTEEIVEDIRKDLLRLIKNDLKKLKRSKQKGLESTPSFNSSEIIQTSTPEGAEALPSDDVYDNTSIDYSEAMKSNTEESSLASSSVESPFSTEKEEICKTKTREKRKLPKKDLPKYPDNPRDPVNLYHFYRRFWDKYKSPGEDPRTALRWEVRQNLQNLS